MADKPDNDTHKLTGSVTQADKRSHADKLSDPTTKEGLDHQNKIVAEKKHAIEIAEQKEELAAEIAQKEQQQLRSQDIKNDDALALQAAVADMVLDQQEAFAETQQRMLEEQNRDDTSWDDDYFDELEDKYGEKISEEKREILRDSQEDLYEANMDNDESQFSSDTEKESFIDSVGDTLNSILDDLDIDENISVPESSAENDDSEPEAQASQEETKELTNQDMPDTPEKMGQQAMQAIFGGISDLKDEIDIARGKKQRAQSGSESNNSQAMRMAIGGIRNLFDKASEVISNKPIVAQPSPSNDTAQEAQEPASPEPEDNDIDALVEELSERYDNNPKEPEVTPEPEKPEEQPEPEIPEEKPEPEIPEKNPEPEKPEVTPEPETPEQQVTNRGPRPEPSATPAREEEEMQLTAKSAAPAIGNETDQPTASEEQLQQMQVTEAQFSTSEDVIREQGSRRSSNDALNDDSTRIGEYMDDNDKSPQNRSDFTPEALNQILDNKNSALLSSQNDDPLAVKSPTFTTAFDAERKSNEPNNSKDYISVAVLEPSGDTAVSQAVEAEIEASQDNVAKNDTGRNANSRRSPSPGPG